MRPFKFRMSISLSGGQVAATLAIFVLTGRVKKSTDEYFSVDHPRVR